MKRLALGNHAWGVVVAATLVSLVAAPALSQAPAYPPQIDGAHSVVYKTVGDTELRLWIFGAPPDPTDRRAAIVFFFGGGWRQGSPTQFEHQARALAERGLFVALADYRVENRHGAKITDCIADARDAVAYLRSKSSLIGIDPRRIAAGGGSAGGHLAAATAFLSEGPGSRPDLLALFNPAVVLAPIAGQATDEPERWRRLEERFGVEPETVSPYHHVAEPPPSIVFHGKDDVVVPYWTVERYCERLAELGQTCELNGYDGAGHGFFNYGRDDNRAYDDTVAKLIDFLERHGYLTSESTSDSSTSRRHDR